MTDKNSSGLLNKLSKAKFTGAIRTTTLITQLNVPAQYKKKRKKYETKTRLILI